MSWPELSSAVRRWVARSLETQRFSGHGSRWLASAYARSADPVRPLRLPLAASRRSHGRRPVCIGVGGARLGGNHKTPFCLELARALVSHSDARAPISIGVVVSGYGSRVSFPLRVTPEHSVPDVTDEANWLARELAPIGVSVFIGPTRQASLDLAAQYADLLILDGVLQTRPQRLALSVLLVGPGDLLGNRCPPMGDLRASAERLCLAADWVLSEPPIGSSWGEATTVNGTRQSGYSSRLLGAVGAGRNFDLSQLAACRLGLVLAIARPERVLANLQQHGIFPISTKFFADHDRTALLRAASGVPSCNADLWLTSSKCQAKLGSSFQGRPLFALRHELEISPKLVDEISQLRLGLDIPGTSAAPRISGFQLGDKAV